MRRALGYEGAGVGQAQLPRRPRHSTNADGLTQTNVFVVVDLVNHELGTLRDAIVKVVRRYGVLSHVDAAQALCKVHFDASEFDSVAVTAHKVNRNVVIRVAGAAAGVLAPGLRSAMLEPDALTTSSSPSPLVQSSGCCRPFRLCIASCCSPRSVCLRYLIG
jgi:hypothetical protein